jgi:ATP synthase protein I
VQQHWNAIGRYGTVGLELGLSIVFGLLGGRWLDAKFGTHGVLTVVGFGFGLAAGIRSVWRALQQANREADRAAEQDRKAREDFHNDSQH